MANEVYFPPEVFEIIQSFFNARDLARFSILSKSWYISYPKRPEIVFDEYDPKFFLHDQFSEFCTETLNWHKTQNLMLDKFTLIMEIDKQWEINAYDFSLRNKLAGKLITSALELGVTEILLKFEYFFGSLRFDLPAQIFASTSLIHLSVHSYVIDGVIGDRVLCSRLKSLVFYRVKTTDGIIRDILARCPLIENLDLRECVGIEKLNVSKLINLGFFRVVNLHEFFRVVKWIKVEFMDFDGMNVSKFRCLRQLHLEKVRIGAEFFTTRFGSMFPCVEDLTLEYCGGDYGYDKINISSHSIKRLSLYRGERFKKVKLNVPNISKFVFKAGSNNMLDIKRNRFKPLPSISFDYVSKIDWESDVRMVWACDAVHACWFKDLNKFLNQLSLSRISLTVQFSGQSVIPGEDIISCLDPVVENLVCHCHPHNTESLLRGLSMSCRLKT